MTDDFNMYQGDDVTIYFCITDKSGDPEDVSAISAATWVAVPMDTETPTMTKHRDVMTIGVDPELQGATVQNCIFVPITSEDTGNTESVGQFRHEIRITLNDLQSVVYPEIGNTATFSVVPSLTWNAGTTPPAPRITRPDGVEEKDIRLVRREARRKNEVGI